MEIWLANLEPVKGSEHGKIRPVVIISGNLMNDNLPIIISCPLSTIIKNYAGCVFIEKNNVNNLNADSEIISFQVRALSKQRFTKKIGQITPQQLEKVIEGVNDAFIL